MITILSGVPSALCTIGYIPHMNSKSEQESCRAVCKKIFFGGTIQFGVQD